ncbi:glycosyltransferase [Sphingomonas sp. AP4-R1]|uniref:glycosyltransferase n=1 Tax=Sphingomonas sp. AP4-R1 TaxID=2735134 RepID=UPI001493DCFE|nr:glycosyltransferase [Sphingomonas sp. AP4-R1]QJU60341.1 glycosyltransferase [Sphingomonas sp. AP4-R1]
MRSLRIAYVINSVEGGGAALPVPSIADVLRKNGAEVAIFALTRRDGRAIAPMEAAGFPVIVRDGGEKDHVAALRWLDAQMRAWRPDVIWTSLTRATLLGQLIGLRRRRTVVSWQHAAFLKPANLRLLRATNRLSRLWLGDSETITRMTADRLGIGADRLMTWPIFRANPRAPTGAIWQPCQRVRIGSLGRLHPVKGYDVLIETLRRLPPDLADWELAIGGDGAERPALEAAIAAAGLGERVRLAGYVDPAAFLAGLHLYVQPSRSEGLCVAAHEALTAGLPVVASAVGELPRAIDPSVGRLAPPGDPDALAAALADLLSQPEELAPMGAAARTKMLDRFGPDRFEAAGKAILDRLRG